MSANFFDTNVILYLLDESPKAEKAEHLIAQGGMISVQVLNETDSGQAGRLRFN